MMSKTRISISSYLWTRPEERAELAEPGHCWVCNYVTQDFIPVYILAPQNIQGTVIPWLKDMVPCIILLMFLYCFLMACTV